MEGPSKIVQIETAAPLRDHATRPFLFALDESGTVWVRNWNDAEWNLLKDIK